MQNTESKHFTAGSYIALALIIVAGAALRLYNLPGLSLSNDELSALTRTLYPDLQQLINYGVVKLDTHPAGVETFIYYYTKCFGQDEFTLRLPFAICGILTIPLCFSLFKKWFGNTTALFTAASVALLQYPVFYSQLARPYILGLLFCTLLLLCWTCLYQENTSKIKKIFCAAGYIFFSALCAYTHYISLLFAGIVWFCSIFYIRKRFFKLHFTAGFLALVLYIPHLWIFLAQFRKGGLTWLGKPGWDFLAKYIFYVFNESWFVFGFAAVFILSFCIYTYRRKCFKKNKYRGFALLLFMLVFVISFLKSYFGKPVLQYSTLIFVFPLLLAFLFSFTENVKISTTLKFSLLFLWCSICIYSIIFEKKYYKTEQYGQFKPLAEDIKRWNKTYGAENITVVLNSYAPYYFRYYLPAAADTQNVVFERFDELPAIDSLFKIVNSSNTNYFVYGRSNIASPPEIDKIIRLKYNEIAEDDPHFNSQITIYRLTNPEIKPILQLYDSAEKNGFELPYTPLLKNALLRVEADITLSERLPEIDAVASVENKNGITFWRTGRLEEFFATKDQKHVKLVWYTTLPPEVKANDLLKIYIWNRSTAKIEVRNFAAKLY